MTYFISARIRNLAFANIHSGPFFLFLTLCLVMLVGLVLKLNGCFVVLVYCLKSNATTWALSFVYKDWQGARL